MTDLWDRLVDYLAGELPDDARDAFEELLFSTPGIGPEVAALLGLIDLLTGVGRAMGGLSPVVSAADVEALARAGHALVEVGLAPGQVLETPPIPDGVEFIVARLTLPADVGRDPLVVQLLGGEERPDQLRLEVRDAPWDPEGGELLIVCHRHMAEQDRVTCFRVMRAGGSDPLADYVVALPPR